MEDKTRKLIPPESFIKKFHIKENGYSTPTQLNDYKYGFTATKPYKNIWKNGKDYYTFINFAVNYPGEKQDVNPKNAQLIAHFDLTEKRNNQFFVTESVNNVLTKPINMNSVEDFFVDLVKGKFFDNQNRQLSAESILTLLYNQHLKPTKRIVGIGIRTRLWLWRKTISFLNYSGIGLKYLLWMLTGEYYSYDHFRDLMLSRKESRKEIDEKTDTIESSSISGFNARPHTILAFCGIHLTIFFILYLSKVNVPLFNLITRSSFLSVVYSVFALGITDRVYPIYSKKLQRYLSKLQWQLNVRSFKI